MLSRLYSFEVSGTYRTIYFKESFDSSDTGLYIYKACLRSFVQRTGVSFPYSTTSPHYGQSATVSIESADGSLFPLHTIPGKDIEDIEFLSGIRYRIKSGDQLFFSIGLSVSMPNSCHVDLQLGLNPRP